MSRQVSREARRVERSDRECTSCTTRHVRVRVIPEQHMTQAKYFGNRPVDTRAATAEHATANESDVETKMNEKSFGLYQHGSQEE